MRLSSYDAIVSIRLLVLFIRIAYWFYTVYYETRTRSNRLIDTLASNNGYGPMP